MFDSIIKPLIILSTIPLSILGVLIRACNYGINISMPSLIGMVGLSGVIVNDGIIMMDFIKKQKFRRINSLFKNEIKTYFINISYNFSFRIINTYFLLFRTSFNFTTLWLFLLGFGILWAT